MSLPMVLLMSGTALILATRLYVYQKAHVPPPSWLFVDSMTAAGPAFGWMARSGGEAALWLGVVWLCVGLLSVMVGRAVVKSFESISEEMKSLDDEGNRLVSAMEKWRSVERPEFDDDSMLSFAEKRRVRLTPDSRSSA